MKDYKPKVINVTNNIRATIYPNGDFDISFLYDENRRWEGYARTGHNGNKALKALAKKNPDFANNFTFSLHHVFPRTVSKNDVLYYESLLKNKLGSRAYGLNEN